MTTRHARDTCVTHHFACDCREYEREQAQLALQLIRNICENDAESRGRWNSNLELIAEMCNDALEYYDARIRKAVSDE